jgi:hypothetical protein
LDSGRILPIIGILLFALPAPARGEMISFSNNSRLPLVVQLSSVVRGGVRRDRPYALFPGGKASIFLPGPKLVQIYDGRLPNRILFQDNLPPSNVDVFFSIQPDPRGLPKMNLQQVKPPINFQKIGTVPGK